MEKIKIKKVIVILLVLVLLINQIFPIISAATYIDETDQEKYNILRISEIKQSSSGNYVFYVEYAAIGDGYIGSFDISINYDTDLFATARKTTGAANSSVANITVTDSDHFTFQKKTVSAGNIRMTGTTTDWYCPEEDGDASEEYGGEISIFKVYFYLKDPTQWKLDGSNEITTDMIAFHKENSLQTGYKQRVADNEDGTNPTYLQSLDYVITEGFAEGSKTVTSLTLKNAPTDLTYENGDTLDFSGGVITIEYSDGTSEDKDIATAISDGIITPDSLYASDSARKVKFTAGTVSLEVPYYTLSGISLKQNPTKMTYDHGDILDFTDGLLELTYTDCNSSTVTENLSIQTGISDGKVTVSATKADVNTPTVNLSYGTLSGASITFTVNDPIDHIAVTTPPTTTTYNDGETISFTGGVITAYKKSGATSQIQSTDTGISLGTTIASISSIHESQKWTIEGGNGLQAGTQEVTVSYDGKSTSYNITVNDTISTINVISQPTAENKYGTTALDFTGLKVLVSTTGGGSFTVDNNSVNIDTSKFNNQLLTAQSFNVAYDGITSSTDATITLKDYITDITPTFTNTTFEYGASLSDIVSGATYTKTYASGAVSVAESITTDMISGYNSSPSPVLFNTSHETTETIGITLSTGTNSFDMVPITKNQIITIKDKITGIEINNYPSTVGFDYGDTFTSTNGKIKTIYASGATGDIIYMSSSDVSLTETDGSTINMKPAISTFTDGVSTKDILVTYTKDGQSYTTTYQITIQDTVDSISINTQPTKDFGYGDTFTTGNGSLLVSYSSGNTDTVLMSDLDVSIYQDDNSAPSTTLTTFGADNKYQEKLNVEYGGKKVDYTITVTNEITGITVSTTPKTTYNVNETLDISTGKIEVARAAGGTPEEIAMTDSNVSVTGFNSTVENASLPLTVSYTENGITKQTTYNVEVKDSVTSISASGTPTEAKYNEELDLTGATISVVKGSGTSSIDVTESMISGYDKTQLGNQTVTITYGGQQDTFVVNVKDYVTGIAVNPSTVTGKYGDTLSTLITDNSIEYTVTYAKAGAQAGVTLVDTMVSGYSATSTSAQSLTVKYTDNDTSSATNGTTFDATLNVTLKDTISSITVTAPTSTQSYNYGGTLDLTGATITVNYASGATPKTVTPTTAMVVEQGTTNAVSMSPATSEFSSVNGNKVTKTVTLTYTEDGVTGSEDYQIEIINDVQGISIHSTNHKTEYNVNDTLDVTNLEILVTRAVGTPEAISVDASMVTGFDSSVENTSLPLTISYTENGITKQTTYNVEVKDSVTKVVIVKLPSKVIYKYDEDLDVTDGEIEITKGSGTTTINMTADMFKTYSKTTLGEQSLTLEYGGQTAETIYDITVKDYVKGIKIDPAEVTGTYGDALSTVLTDKNINYVVTYASKGEQTPMPLTTSMITTTYNERLTAEQTLTVKYSDNDENSATNGTDFTADLKITLQNEIISASITVPSKSTYNHGESLDLSDGAIMVTYADGTTDTMAINANMVTEADGSAVVMSPSITDYTADNTVDKTLKIEYTVNSIDETENYPITIINDVKSIKIVSTPKDNYNVGDSLDVTAGIIEVTRAVGNPEEINMTDGKVEVKGFDNTQENTELELTVEFTENGIKATTTYEVSVIDSVLAVEIDSLPKQAYKYGETLDVSGGKLKITRSSGIEYKDITESMVSELDGTSFDSTVTGTRNLIVTYGGVDMPYEISVTDYISGITVTPPSKTTYEYGEALDLTGGFITIVMASGSTQDVDLSNSSVTVSSMDSTSVGAQTINIKYDEFTAQFGVRVEDNIQSIIIKNTPKTDYKYGEALNVTDGTILATRTSGDTELVSIENSMVSGYDPTTLGSQELTITYSGKEAKYRVNVEDYLESIEIVKPNKLIYSLGEGIDLTGGQVIEKMASGATTPVAMTSEMISGFDSTSEGAKTITVTYKGLTDTFGITVQDPASSMIILKLPNKLDYKYGESLALEGGIIKITKESGATEELDITKDMVSGYNPNKLGEQTLTVKYNDFTQEFKVNVEDYVSKLSVTAPNKVNYEYGETLDLTGGKVSIVMASGAIQEKADLTASMVSGYNATSIGNQTIAVSYKDLSASFKVNVEDKVKGISINTLPNKTNYENGENLDLAGATIKVVKSSGEYIVQVTNDMVSGYNAKNAGSQVLSVSYGGLTTTFVVSVEKAPVKTSSNKKKKSSSSTNSNAQISNSTSNTDENQNIDEQTTQVPTSKPSDSDSDSNENKEQNSKEDKSVEVKKKSLQFDLDLRKLIAGIIIGLALLLLILLLVFKRNVKIYVEEDGKLVLGGLDKVSKKNLKLNIDKYLDKDTYANKAKIVLSDSISDKLNGEELEITHRGVTFKHKIVYNDKPYEIMLEKAIVNMNNSKEKIKK